MYNESIIYRIPGFLAMVCLSPFFFFMFTCIGFWVFGIAPPELLSSYFFADLLFDGFTAAGAFIALAFVVLLTDVITYEVLR